MIGLPLNELAIWLEGEIQGNFGQRYLDKITDEFDWIPTTDELERAGGPDKWFQNRWHDISFQTLLGLYSRREIIVQWRSTIFQSRFSDSLDGRWNRYGPTCSASYALKRIENSYWQWGSYEKVEAEEIFDLIGRLSTFDLGWGPDFEARLDMSTGPYNLRGLSVSDAGLYLDAPLALLIHYKGKHVLTVGFAPTRKAIQIVQVQLREKKGNRWLFSLKEHYLALVVQAFKKAFKRVALIEGQSAVDYAKQAYSCPPQWAPGVEERIETLYDRGLVDFQRGKRYRSNGLVFRYISRKHREEVRDAA